MGFFDPVSWAVMAAQAAQAMAAQAAAIELEGLSMGAGLIGGGAAGAGAAKGGAAASGSALTPGLEPAFSATAQQSGMQAAAKAVGGAALKNPAVQAAASAGATAGVQQALDSKAGKQAQVKLAGPGVADQGAGAAADAERMRRKPGRPSTVLTSPLGLRGPGAAGGARPATIGARSLLGG